MTLKYTGTITIENGLTLLNPKMDIISVDYKLNTNNYFIEIEFYEGVYRHNRRFEGQGQPGQSFSMADVINYISNHPILNQFNPI